MEQRTCNIILCCKGWCDLNPDKKHSTLEKDIAFYMSKECGCPVEDYTGNLLYSILKDAIIDFFDTADNPKLLFREFLQDSYLSWSKELTMSERIIQFFTLVEVKDLTKGEYVNGFTKELIEIGERYLSK